ncbi:MAG TPA: hypothetical protein VNG29_01025 [Candidatus Paceibacterota bacterium]|nr:hypothetical protein [Candidatus Paceibacterota bacterium]
MPSKLAEEFLGKYRAYLAEREAGEFKDAPKIHVDEIASKVAAFYEKTRNIIDYREEHLLRKNTIERALRRRIFLKEINAKFAEPLVKELIRSGHLPNDSVPEAKIPEVQKIIDNLIYLLGHDAFKDEREKETVSRWLIAISGAAIEEELFPRDKERMLSDAMFAALKAGIVVRNAAPSEQEINIQLFIAIQRALFRPDNVQLEYRFLRFAYPEWGKMDAAALEETARNLASLKTSLGHFFKYPLAPQFQRLANREKTVFLIFGDVMTGASAASALADPDRLASETKFFYDRRYGKARAGLRKLAFLSVVSFLISKLLVAFAIEVPLDKYLSHSFSFVSVGVNILFPPLLMLMIVAYIRLPSSANYDLVAAEVAKLVRSDEPKKYVVAAPTKRGAATVTAVWLAYLVTLAAILYGLVKFLLWIYFSPASIVIFALFTSMVIATGVRVNNRAKEMSLEKEKASMWSFVLDLVIVPFMAIGRWTISGLSKFNVLVIVFNFLLELPLQLFVEFLENFRGFIRSKKEEEAN